MRLTLEEIDGVESSKIGLLMGHGPSLKKDIHRLFELSKEKDRFCIFSTGDMRVIENAGFQFDLDYWAVANTDFTVRKNYEDINKYENVKFLYADAVDKTPNPELLLKVNFIPFDQRHFNEQNCIKNWKPGDPNYSKTGNYFCCNGLDNNHFIGKKTLQEYVACKCNSIEHYSTASTSALHMLATAIITGCSEIYLFGVDLDYSLGYADNKTTNNDSFGPYLGEILNDFSILKNSAKNIGIKIYNVSKNSPISNVIETKEFDL